MLGKWLWCGSNYWLICTSIISTDMVSRYMTSIGSYHVILQMLSDMHGRLIISKYQPTALLWLNLPSFRVLLFQEHLYTSLPSFVPSFNFVLFLVFLLETGQHGLVHCSFDQCVNDLGISNPLYSDLFIYLSKISRIFLILWIFFNCL